MRKIGDLYKEKKHVFSFEFFPPKNEEGEKKLLGTIHSLKPLNPDFVSVTYGAGGSTRAKTKEWVTSIQDKENIVAMAHLTCVGSSQSELQSILQELHDGGIRNIMALRGDPPKGEVNFIPQADGFAHASDLIRFIHEIDLDFSIGAASYPEKHMEAISAEADLSYLKLKMDNGADFSVSQLFFDNRVYFEFVSKCRAAGITKPIVPGIMPITHFKQIERFTGMAGCSFPPGLIDEIKSAGENLEKLLEVSLRFSKAQCKELLDKGAPGIHFYTLNQSMATTEILKALQ